MGEPSTVAVTQNRTVLTGMGERLFKLMSRGATSTQWAEWLRAPLEHAVARGDKGLALCLLKAGANSGAGWKGCHGRTLLQAAAEGGNQEIVSTLLEKGGSAELDAASGCTKMTALHRAGEGGHTAAARTLMVEGANASLLDSRRRSVLHYAAEGGNSQLIGYLMIAAVDLDVKDVAGNTPLHLAAAKGHDKIVRTLLRRQGNFEMSNCEGQHALHLAVKHGHIAAVEELLRAGADPNIRYGKSNRHSPLYLGKENVTITKALVRHGADVTKVDELGYTALHWAAYRGRAAVVDALLDAGADVEARKTHVQLKKSFCFKGLTPLHVATHWHNFEGMASLLRRGANVNARDSKGLTPLHLVCKFSDRAQSAMVADFLLRRGADETVTNDDGCLAIEFVEDSGTNSRGRRMRRLLVNAPADRAWRRRGMLVMCRSRSAKVRSEGREERLNKIVRPRKGIGADTAAAAAAAAAADTAGDSNGDGRLLLTRVVDVDADVVFQTIVGFL